MCQVAALPLWSPYRADGTKSEPGLRSIIINVMAVITTEVTANIADMIAVTLSTVSLLVSDGFWVHVHCTRR